MTSAAQSQAALASPPPPRLSPDVVDKVTDLGHQIDQLSSQYKELAAAVGKGANAVSRLDIFHGYMGVFVVAFLVTLLTTPLIRRLALKHGVVDRPTVARKLHREPVAYLGGVAVYLGILLGIFFAYTMPYHHLGAFHASRFTGGLPGGVPLSVVLGMTVIMFCGLWDDVVGLDPRAKIAGQLFAAAALATTYVGVKVAAGVLIPAARELGLGTTMLNGTETVAVMIPLPGAIFGQTQIPIDLVYWVGTAVIAVFVLGACNASNLIDGLDGLLSGTTAIASAGLLIVALGQAMADDGPLDSSRLVLCLCVLGACLGFLPHNFNPATIFLGDCGSLLLGFCTIVIVLSLGDTGRTDLVLAGLIIYAIPIIDTTLAIVRRKVAGRKMSDSDDQHLHHMLRRALGVKGAVMVLYGIGAGFAALGVALSEGRGRVTYAIALVFSAFIGVTAYKNARRAQATTAAPAAGPGVPSGQPMTGSVAAVGAAAGSQPAGTGTPMGVRKSA